MENILDIEDKNDDYNDLLPVLFSVPNLKRNLQP